MYNPDLYARYNIHSRRGTDEFTEEFSEELGKMSGRCLDVGSGPCDVIADIILPKLNRKATVVCSDISKPMIRFGKERYGDNPRLSFMELDIESPELPQNLVEQFDQVTSFYCLHWCQDMRQVFENIFDLLRPGGTALLSFIASYPGLDAYTKLATIPQYQPYMKTAYHHIPVFQHTKWPRKSFKTVLNEVGFEVLHCSLREKTHIFKNEDNLRECILPVNPFIDRIPSKLREEFGNDLTREFAKHCIRFNRNNVKDDEHSILAIYKLFAVYLKKPSAK